MVGDFESDFLEGEEFHTAFRWLVEYGSTCCVILSGKHAICCCLGKAVVFNGCRLKCPYTVDTEK